MATRYPPPNLVAYFFSPRDGHYLQRVQDELPAKKAYTEFMQKFWFLFALYFTPLNTLAIQVMIDPGHGGIDSGTSHSGMQEKDLVLKVATYLRTLLDGNPQFNVQMTREKDQHLSLKERVRKAEDAQADLFISLHANSNPDRRVKGTEVYFQNSLPPDEESLILADLENQSEAGAPESKAPVTGSGDPSKKGDIMAIVEDLQRQYRVKNSLMITQMLATNWQDAVIRQAPFFVVSKTTMPSVLVEVGFLSHQEESQKLNTPKHQQEIAQKIYKAVLQYKEMMDKIEDQALD